MTSVSRAGGDRIRRAGPVFRLVVAVGLVAAAPLVHTATHDDQVRFGLIVAFVWIPLSGLLSLAGRRTQHPAIDVVGLGVDLALLGIVQVTLSPRAEVYVLVHLLLVAYYTYLGGRRLGFVAGALGFFLIAVVSKGTNNGFDAFAVATYPIVVGGLVWLLDAAAIERWKASDRVDRLHEKSDAILTGVAEAVMVTSPSGRVEQWNHAAELTFGCPFELAEGRTCTDVLGLHLDTRALDCRGGCALLAVHEADGTRTGSDVEVWRLEPTGDRQPLLATALPVIERDGVVVEVVHSFRDVTKLKQADEAKTLFLATASHELKTPLTVIRGFSQMLSAPDAEMSDDERAAALRAIDTRARQLTGIVDRLLLSSRIEAGRIDLSVEPVDASPILAEQVSSLRAATSRDVVLDLEDDLPLLLADPAAFLTVVDHLLDNAVKYSPAGGPIRVRAGATRDHVEMTVSDEGVGMNAEQAAHCFDKFWQAELSDIRRFGGTGIGLYIVRSLVEAMDGRISVTSSPGEGSTFVVTFERADRARPDPADVTPADRGRGDRSIIREYMRQLGVRVESRE